MKCLVTRLHDLIRDVSSTSVTLADLENGLLDGGRERESGHFCTCRFPTGNKSFYPDSAADSLVCLLRGNKGQKEKRGRDEDQFTDRQRPHLINLNLT